MQMNSYYYQRANHDAPAEINRGDLGDLEYEAYDLDGLRLY